MCDLNLLRELQHKLDVNVYECKNYNTSSHKNSTTNQYAVNIPI